MVGSKSVSGRDAINGVFVVGCPRSGTSALAWALAEHPAFVAGPESNFLWNLFGHGGPQRAWEHARSIEDGWLALNGVSLDEFCVAVGSGLEHLFASRSGGKRWVESSPENVLIASDLALVFPGARFVHLVRDGRAVVASMLNSGFGEPWSQDFDEACRTWAFYVAEGLRAQRELGDRMLTVVHQFLVEWPVPTCAGLLRFLGEPDHPGPASFLRTNRINSSYDARSREDMKRPKSPQRLRQRPWLAWPPEWHARFEKIAGQAAAVVADLAREGLPAWGASRAVRVGVR